MIAPLWQTTVFFSHSPIFSIYHTPFFLDLASESVFYVFLSLPPIFPICHTPFFLYLTVILADAGERLAGTLELSSSFEISPLEAATCILRASDCRLILPRAPAVPIELMMEALHARLTPEFALSEGRRRVAHYRMCLPYVTLPFWLQVRIYIYTHIPRCSPMFGFSIWQARADDNVFG